MIIIKETQGDTLQGAIDNSNTVYTTSFDYNEDSVNIYVNGRLKIKSWDDGFVTRPPRTIILNEALLIGDSLEVEYKADVKTGGGADGGCPSAMESMILNPQTQSDDLEPDTNSDLLETQMLSDGENRSVLFPDELRPVIIQPLDGSDS